MKELGDWGQLWWKWGKSLLRASGYRARGELTEKSMLNAGDLTIPNPRGPGRDWFSAWTMEALNSLFTQMLNRVSEDIWLLLESARARVKASLSVQPTLLVANFQSQIAGSVSWPKASLRASSFCFFFQAWFLIFLFPSLIYPLPSVFHKVRESPPLSTLSLFPKGSLSGGSRTFLAPPQLT